MDRNFFDSKNDVRMVTVKAFNYMQVDHQECLFSFWRNNHKHTGRKTVG